MSGGALDWGHLRGPSRAPPAWSVGGFLVSSDRTTEWLHRRVDLVKVHAHKAFTTAVASESAVCDHLADCAIGDAEVLGGIAKLDVSPSY